MKKQSQKKLYKLLLLYLVLWIVLFEFILPANKILPKPTIVLLSFSALWNDYKLGINLLATISSIYIALIAAYFMAKYTAPIIFKKNHLFAEFIFSLHWFSIYIPWLIFGLFLIYWFPLSSITEIIFLFIISIFSFIVKLKEESLSIKREYIDSAISLGAGENTISREIIWKEVQPNILKHAIQLHFNLWSLAIIFEFIRNGYGLGKIFRLALDYKDLSAIFSISIIIGVIVFLGRSAINYYRNKFCRWSLN